MTALILDIARTGREASGDEIRAIRTDVAAVGFDPNAVSRVGLVAQGVRWAGRTVQSNDRLSTDVVHYLRHVIAGEEWPHGTTLSDYVRSLQATIRNQETGVHPSRFAGVWSVAFVGRSGVWCGPEVAHGF